MQFHISCNVSPTTAAAEFTFCFLTRQAALLCLVGHKFKYIKECPNILTSNYKNYLRKYKPNISWFTCCLFTLLNSCKHCLFCYSVNQMTWPTKSIYNIVLLSMSRALHVGVKWFSHANVLNCKRSSAQSCFFHAQGEKNAHFLE